MTKLKSKKMTKSTFAIIIMAIAMVALLAFGGTYAYFTATTKEISGKSTLGYLSLSNSATKLNVTEKVVPGQNILDEETITLVDSSDVATFVFVRFSATTEAADLAGKITATIKKGDTALTAVEGQTGVYYLETAGVAEATDIELKVSVTLDSSIDENNANGALTKETSKYMGKEVTVTFNAMAIQKIGADGNEMTVAAAYALVDFTNGVKA